MTSSSVLIVVAVGSATSATAIAADPPRVTIAWQAPAACPGPTWFEARVEAFLGRPVEQAAKRDLHATAHVRAAEQSFEGALEWTNEDGSETRELSDPDCRVLADALAFVVASAIDPLVSYETAAPIDTSEAAVPPPPPPAEPTPKTPKPGETAQPRLGERKPPRTSGPALRWALGPVVQAQSGVLPELAALLGGTGELRAGAFRGAATLTAAWPRQGALPSGANADYFAIVGTIDACWLAIDAGIELPVCAVADFGGVRGRGQVQNPAVSWLPWAALGVGVSLAAPLADDLAGRLGASLGKVVARPRFSVDNQPATEPPVLTGGLSASLEWRFR